MYMLPLPSCDRSGQEHEAYRARFYRLHSLSNAAYKRPRADAFAEGVSRLNALDAPEA